MSGVLVVAVEAEELWGVDPVGVESGWIRREGLQRVGGGERFWDENRFEVAVRFIGGVH